MGNSMVLAFYITVGCVAFVISKIIISVLLYRRWKRKHMVYEDGYSGMGDNNIYTDSPIQLV
jgi:hypothetical protein